MPDYNDWLPHFNFVLKSINAWEILRNIELSTSVKVTASLRIRCEPVKAVCWLCCLVAVRASGGSVADPTLPVSVQFIPAMSAGAGLEQRVHALTLSAPRPAEPPPVAPVIMSPSVHSQEPSGEPPPPPPHLYSGWQVLTGAGGPSVLVPACSAQPPYPSGFYSYTVPPAAYDVSGPHRIYSVTCKMKIYRELALFEIFY